MIILHPTEIDFFLRILIWILLCVIYLRGCSTHRTFSWTWTRGWDMNLIQSNTGICKQKLRTFRAYKVPIYQRDRLALCMLWEIFVQDISLIQAYNAHQLWGLIVEIVIIQIFYVFSPRMNLFSLHEHCVRFKMYRLNLFLIAEKLSKTKTFRNCVSPLGANT